MSIFLLGNRKQPKSQLKCNSKPIKVLLLIHKHMVYILIRAHKMFLMSFEENVAGFPIRPTDFRRDLFHYSSCKKDLSQVLSNLSTSPVAISSRQCTLAALQSWKRSACSTRRIRTCPRLSSGSSPVNTCKSLKDCGSIN